LAIQVRQALSGKEPMPLDEHQLGDRGLATLLPKSTANQILQIKQVTSLEGTKKAEGFQKSLYINVVNDAMCSPYLKCCVWRSSGPALPSSSTHLGRSRRQVQNSRPLDRRVLGAWNGRCFIGRIPLFPTKTFPPKQGHFLEIAVMAGPCLRYPFY
jgi:hypothetical protein